MNFGHKSDTSLVKAKVRVGLPPLPPQNASNSGHCICLNWKHVHCSSKGRNEIPAPGFMNLPFRGSVLLLDTTFLHDSHGVLSACFFPFSIFSLCSSLHFPLDNLTHCSSAATIFIPNCSLSALPLSAHLSPLKSTLQPAPVTSHPGQHVGNLAWMCQAELNYSFFSSNSSLSTLAVRAALHSRHYSTDILPKALYMMNVSHIENTLCCRCSD